MAEINLMGLILGKPNSTYGIFTQGLLSLFDPCREYVMVVFYYEQHFYINEG